MLGKPHPCGDTSVGHHITCSLSTFLTLVSTPPSHFWSRTIIQSTISTSKAKHPPLLQGKWSMFSVFLTTPCSGSGSACLSRSHSLHLGLNKVCAGGGGCISLDLALESYPGHLIFCTSLAKKMKISRQAPGTAVKKLLKVTNSYMRLTGLKSQPLCSSAGAVAGPCTSAIPVGDLHRAPDPLVWAWL